MADGGKRQTATVPECRHCKRRHWAFINCADAARKAKENPSSTMDGYEWALYVWRGDGRYLNAPTIPGTRAYKRQADAERVAKVMNDRGDHGGMVVARQRPIPKQNPPLVVLGNPGKSRGSHILSKNIVSIRYQHAADGDFYEHKFKKGSVIELLSDGSIRVYSPRGVKLWGDY